MHPWARFVHYRLYQSDDFMQLYAIEEVCFQPPFRFGRRYMRSLVDSPNSITWIAEDEGAMAGFAIVDWGHTNSEVAAYIQTIEVLPIARAAASAPNCCAASKTPLAPRAHKPSGCTWTRRTRAQSVSMNATAIHAKAARRTTTLTAVPRSSTASPSRPLPEHRRVPPPSRHRLKFTPLSFLLQVECK